MQMTITEALAEIKLLNKKLESKKAYVLANLSRPTHLPDPLKDGPSVMAAETQSISDLLKRLVKIRHEIAKANLATEITVDNRTMSMSDWLTWKREVYDLEKTFVIIQYSFNLSYPEWVQKHSELEALYEKLDGQLSLKNATVVVDV